MSASVASSPPIDLTLRAKSSQGQAAVPPSAQEFSAPPSSSHPAIKLVESTVRSLGAIIDTFA